MLRFIALLKFTYPDQTKWYLKSLLSESDVSLTLDCNMTCKEVFVSMDNVG
jgi:hypothetical protein